MFMHTQAKCQTTAWLLKAMFQEQPSGQVLDFRPRSRVTFVQYPVVEMLL